MLVTRTSAPAGPAPPINARITAIVVMILPRPACPSCRGRSQLVDAAGPPVCRVSPAACPACLGPSCVHVVSFVPPLVVWISGASGSAVCGWFLLPRPCGRARFPALCAASGEVGHPTVLVSFRPDWIHVASRVPARRDAARTCAFSVAGSFSTAGRTAAPSCVDSPRAWGFPWTFRTAGLHTTASSVSPNRVSTCRVSLNWSVKAIQISKSRRSGLISRWSVVKSVEMSRCAALNPPSAAVARPSLSTLLLTLFLGFINDASDPCFTAVSCREPARSR